MTTQDWLALGGIVTILAVVGAALSPDRPGRTRINPNQHLYLRATKGRLTDVRFTQSEAEDA